MASKEKEKDDTRRKDKEVAAGDVTVASKTAALRKERVEDKSEHGENRSYSYFHLFFYLIRSDGTHIPEKLTEERTKVAIV